MRLPIGYDNFQSVRENNLEFVDKSLFIKDILDETSQVAVITRPRRFGKTFNLSMLHYFLAAVAFGKDTTRLFDNLKIAQVADGRYMDHQGKYPVIFLTFKDIKAITYESAYGSICKTFSRLYSEHDYLLQSERLSVQQKLVFNSILSETATAFSVKTALLDLIQYLFLHNSIKPWLLIDEYDNPIHSAYTHGYYDEMINLLREVFGSALKSNPYLNRGVITGILRIAKESLFSRLNNVKVYMVLQNSYSKHFGFTEDEVAALLQQSSSSDQIDVVRDWYNGYNVGQTTLYNPWSIVNYLKERQVGPYWVNTSDNQLIRDLLVQSSENFKTQFEPLLRGEAAEHLIDENIVFGDLQGNESAIWSLLLMAGYVKVVTQDLTDQGLVCQLKIPNREVRNLFRQMVELWLAQGHGISWYNTFLNSLLEGKINIFEESLQQLMYETISYHDTARDPEAFYHGLMLGFTASLYQNKNYELHSNRESGFGRYDYMILSRDCSKPSIIFEFKKVKATLTKSTDSAGTETKAKPHLTVQLAEAAQAALAQISQSKYLTELQRRGCSNIIKIGLAFCGKKFHLVSEFAKT